MDFDLRIGQTGIRSGEFIAGAPRATQSKGIVIQIDGNYPTDVSWVDKLSTTDINDKLNLIPFFAPMSSLQRKEWLYANSDVRKDLYIEDTDVRLKFIKIDGNNFFTKTLNSDQIAQLLRDNPNTSDGFYPVRDVYNMFPRKPGSKARKHTLIFRPSNWSLHLAKASSTSYNGIYMNLDTIQLLQGTVNKDPSHLLEEFTMESDIKTRLPKFAVYANEREGLTLGSMFELCRPWVDPNDLIKFKPILEWFSPSLHKSLIQKLIRTRCLQVEHSRQTYPAVIPLLTSFCMLMTHSGAFVPNIQRFVTGMESAAKRLAVSICEDGYTEDFTGLSSLYTAALMKQHHKNWQPTDIVIVRWLQMAVESQKDHRAFEYDHHNFIDTLNVIDPLSLSYFLLTEIKSFHSDIKMVGSIAEKMGIPRLTNGVDAKIDVMPLVHCIDQHSIGEIAHFMPYPTLPYSQLFQKIWQEVVGVNPRYCKYKDYYPTMEQQLFVRHVRVAQTNLWITKMYTPTSRSSLDIKSSFTYSLDQSWLAGLIGPIEVRLSSGYVNVVLRVDNIYEMIAVKKPSRDKDVSPILTDEEKHRAIVMAKDVLVKGHKLSSVPTTLPIFKNAIVYLEDETYNLVIPSNPSVKYNWDILRKLQYEFPIHPTVNIDIPINISVLQTGDGVDERSPQLLNQLVAQTDIKVLRRLIVYMAGHRDKIKLHKISRDGTGTYYSVVPEDTGVYWFFASIALIYPAAIQIAKTGFVVKNGPLLWTVGSYVSQYLNTNTSFVDRWPAPREETRKRWEHQISSYQQMIDRNNEGKKGHLIWIDVGMGKTLIALDYIGYLIQNQKMPRYCVYTLPPSAIDNTVREIVMKGLPHKLIDARKSAKGNANILDSRVINIVRHDHMILNNMDDQLKSIASECVFIIDEFHKTLAKTKRTSIALEITKLSHDFIGMSGTIIKDSNTDELIQWLEQIVEFEVTNDNYWVAVGALVSRKVQTQVVVERRLIEVEMDAITKQRYYSMVPDKMGGTANHIQFKGALDLSYQVVTEEMVRLTKVYLDAGEGVFVVAKNIAHQGEIKEKLLGLGVPDISISLLGKDNQVTLTPDYQGPIRVVITTLGYNAGYTLTKFRILIQSEYPSNQATREQLEGRINRIGQTSPNVLIITLVTGILTYFHEHHEKARTLSAAIRGFAKDAGVDYKSIVF
jgi:Type III restriction enzyme, res subunit